MLCKLIRAALVAFALPLFASTAFAQFPGPGLLWQGDSGSSGGSFLPECVSDPVGTFPGETVTIQVWGDAQAPYLLFASLNEGPCISIAGVGGGLLLSPPVFPLSTGILTDVSPCLSCPEAVENVVAQVPPTTPVGTAFTLQALAFGGGQPAFTVGIRATVQ